MTNTMKSQANEKVENKSAAAKSDKKLSVHKDAEIGGEFGLDKKHPTSYLESLIHFVKGNVGSGVFAISEAFKLAGIILAPILTVTLGLFCLYGEHVLLSCARMLKERKNLPDYPNFADTIVLGFASGPKVFRIFSKYMKPMVEMFIVITHLGFCCVYYIFVSTTSQQVMAIYGIDFSVRWHMVLFLFPLMIFTLVRRLKYLVPVSLFANLCMGLGICTTIFIIGYDLPPISTRTYVGDIRNIPLFFGTVMYSFEGIGLVLPLKTEMKKPKNFDSPLGVLNVGTFITVTVFTLFGFLGYLRYGEGIMSSITLNLDPNMKLSIFVKIAIGLGIMCSYCLMFFVAMLVIWPRFEKKFGPFKKPVMSEILLRIFFVFVTFVLSEGIPHLGLFISLIGAFSTTGLAMVVPPLCDISMRWPCDFGRLYWRLVLDVITLILAFIGFSTGTFYSLKAIFEAFFK